MAHTPHILIVEDESGIADTIQYALQADGFAPAWVPTAQQAIEHFQKQTPALVILDIGLPDMHGFELFRRLQALPSGANTPMLFLTARSEEIDRVAGLELGADDYIAKPFSPRELVARVRSILRRFEKSNAHASPADSDPVPTSPPPFTCDEERMMISYYKQQLDLSRYE
ncbi:MAG: response regulator, partial [Saezia sp.]